MTEQKRAQTGNKLHLLRRLMEQKNIHAKNRDNRNHRHAKQIPTYRKAFSTYRTGLIFLMLFMMLMISHPCSGLNRQENQEIKLVIINPTETEEFMFNESLCSMIDTMEPAELEKEKQLRYEALKDSRRYKKIVFYNGFTIDPEVTKPIDHNILDKTKTRFALKLTQMLDSNTITFFHCRNITFLGRSGNTLFVRLNPAEIISLTETAFVEGIWEIPVKGKIKESENIIPEKDYMLAIELFEDVSCSEAELTFSGYITNQAKIYDFNEICSEKSHVIHAQVRGADIERIAEKNIVEKIRLVDKTGMKKQTSLAVRENGSIFYRVRNAIRWFIGIIGWKRL